MSKKLKIFSLVLGVLTVGALITAAFNIKSFAQSDNTKNLIATNAETKDSKLLDEMVYVFTTSDGTVRKIVSSDWTKNLDVDEYTTFRNDEKKTPIDLKITYLLDGQDISAKELAGKSGRVTVRFTYTNKEMVSGYYVPYMVISGMVLDNEHFSNVEATNAKIINDGSRIIVAGITLPGMQENLGLSSSELELPSYLEFSADAKDFKLDMSVSLVTNEVFKDIDVSQLDSLDQLESQLNKMNDAMDQLVGGSSDLAQGIETLYEKASALPDGVAKLYDGSLKLANGAGDLNAGITALKSSIESKLIKNANLIVGDNYANSTAISNGVAQLADTVIDAALDEYNPLFEPLFPIFQNFGLPAEALTHENYATNLTAWIAAMDKAEIIAVLAHYGQDAAALKVQFTTLKTKLESIDTLAASVKSYTGGVNQLVAGISGELLSGVTELESGSVSLASGAEELSSGVSTLNDSAPALVSGINQLRDGSTKLSSGLKQFNEEAIQKLLNFYNGDIKRLTSRIKDIAAVARNNSSNTKYIYRTDEIKK